MRELSPASIKAQSGPGDSWGTPMDLWEEIREKYFHGVESILDPTPNPIRLLPGTHTTCANAFGYTWDYPFFCNPPFSDISAFLAAPFLKGCRGVYLLPLRGDQSWFHYAAPAGKVVFIRGRVNYVDASAPNEKKSGASFASCLLIFGIGKGVEYWHPECHKKRSKRV